MKKSVLFTITMMIISSNLFSQWDGETTTTDGTIYRSGWIGLNDCTSPIAPLSITTSSGEKGIYLNLSSDAASAYSPMVLFDARNGGAENIFFMRQESNALNFTRYQGIWTGGLKLMSLEANGNIWLTSSGTSANNDLYAPGHIYLIPRASGISYIQSRRSNNSGSTQLQLRTWNNGSVTEAIRITSYGKVGIGTTNPSAKLTVKGDILASKVEIKNDSEIPASDYVFDQGYNLRSLQEVEQFVKTNRHLPEVPSAKEFKENGYSVGEMDDILLRKVEELTLYIIEQQKTIEQLKSKVGQLEKGE